MASRVNTRFVIILIVGVIALLGLVVVAYQVAFKSSSDLAHSGDQMMAEGDYDRAERLYAKAVYKDSTNTQNLNKWIDALEHIVPETETEYRDQYFGDYLGAIKKTATILRNDISAHERYLKIRYKISSAPYFRQAIDSFIEDTNGALAFFNEDPTTVSEWERLKRYRGLAIVQIAKRDGVLEDSQYLLAQEDLERAIAADPTDTESVIALIKITTINANREIPEHDKEARLSVLKTSKLIADQFVATYPNDVAMAIHVIFLDAEIKHTRIAMDSQGEAQIAARLDSIKVYKPDIESIATRLLGDSSDQLTVELVMLYFGLEAQINRDSNITRTRQMIDSMIESDKNNARLLFTAGMFAKRVGDFEEAFGWYSQIKDLPTLPLSLQGWSQYGTKREALYAQAMIKVDQAQIAQATVQATTKDNDSTPEERDAATRDFEAAILAATQSRDSFSSAVASDTGSLMMVDGKLARAKGEFEESLRLFKKFNEQTARENLEGLWQEGQTAAQLNQLGVAREALLLLIPKDSSNKGRQIRAMALLANIHERLNELPEAAQVYREMLAIDSSIEGAQVALSEIEKFTNPELNDDPVVAALITARLIRLGTATEPGDIPSAIEYLREAIVTFEYDPRIAVRLAESLLNQKDVQGSIDVLTKTRELHPDEEWIEQTLNAMTSNDPVAIRISLIRQSSRATEINKLLSIARLQFDNNLDEDFIDTLAELNSLAPNDKAVIELNFVYAVKNNNLSEANAIAANSINSQNETLSFKARIAIVENNPTKAIEHLERAAASGTANAAIFRMLAFLQRETGNFAGAIESYESSLAITPNNPTAIGEYIMLIAQTGQHEEALNTARRLQRHGSTDINFMNLWLNLEALHGGAQGRTFAIAQRKQMLILNPNNIVNKAQLADLHIQAKQWDEARVLIDDIRASNDSIAAVKLDATWHADQGMINKRNGLVLANEVYAKYVEGLEPPVGADPFISNAEFMLNRGRPDLAVVAAEEAVKRQSPDTMLGSKLLGNLYMRINNYSKAVAVYQEVIEAGADSDFEVRNRLINTFTTLKRYEDAQEIYNQLPAEKQTEMLTMLQAADIAGGLDDAAGASKLLNDAVSRYPTNSFVYIKRAESMIGDESLFNDLLSDIGRAIDLQPNDWRAYRVRAAGNFAINRRDDALKDLRAAVRINPYLDKSIYSILNELLSQSGGAGEAMEIAREVIALRSDDANLMARIGGLFAARQEWERAAEIHGKAWDKRHSVNDGAVYIDSLVRMKRPDAKKANEVISALAKMVGEGGINKSAGLLAAQALVLQASGREDFAQQQITKAFDLSVDKDSDLVGWSGNLSRYFEGKPTQDHVQYLEALKRRKTSSDPDLLAWLDLFIANRLISDDESSARGIEMITQLMGYSQSPLIQIRSIKLYGATLYNQEKFTEAAEIWKSGIDLFSDDWEMNNNLAYVLSSKLDRLDEALSYGQTAIDQNRARSEAYETMAGIYIRLEKYDEAEQMIEQGSKYLLTLPSRITMILTTGRLHLARGMMVEAKSSLADAQAILRSSPTAYLTLNSDIEEYEQEINSAGD